MKRLSREKFWWKFSIPVIIALISSILIYQYSTNNKFKINDLTYALFLLVVSICFIYSIIILIQRLHDFDFSAWYLFAFLILFLVSLLQKPFGGYCLFFFFLLLIVLYIKKGNPGRNRFGADPYCIYEAVYDQTLSKKLETVLISIPKTLNKLINGSTKEVTKSIKSKLNKNIIQNNDWILLNNSVQKIYVFKDDNKLLISDKGDVTEFHYEYQTSKNSILIYKNDVIELYQCNFIEDKFIVMGKHATNYKMYFANFDKYKNRNQSELLAEIISIENCEI